MSFEKISSILLKEDTTIPNIVLVVNKILNYLNSFIQNFIGKPQFNSVLLQNITITSGLNVIPHKLNGTLTGWKIIRQNASSQFYDLQSSSAVAVLPDTYLYLQATLPCVISLEVF